MGEDESRMVPVTPGPEFWATVADILGEPPPVPVIPPDWYVDRWNTAAFANGQPQRTALDPVVMMAWRIANEAPPPGWAGGIVGL